MMMFMVSSLPHVFIFHLFCGILNPEANAATTFNYIRRENRRIRPEYVLEQHELRSKLECVTACSSNSICLSASWGSSAYMCLLTNEDTVDFGVDSNILEEEDGWDTMAKVRYDVVLYRGPSGRYTMTFNEAALLCAQHHTTMASPSDLLFARSKGYDMCNCGWLSDGTNGFVVQQDESWCWYDFTTGINDCDKQFANVYCLLI